MGPRAPTNLLSRRPGRDIAARMVPALSCCLGALCSPYHRRQRAATVVPTSIGNRARHCRPINGPTRPWRLVSHRESSKLGGGRTARSIILHQNETNPSVPSLLVNECSAVNLKRGVLWALTPQSGNPAMSQFWTFAEDRPSTEVRASCWAATYKNWLPEVRASCC